MKVLYIFEPDHKEKFKFLFEKLKDFYTLKDKFIHFVPTLFKKNFLEEKLIDFYKRKYFFLPEIQTPKSFCDKFIIPFINKNIISDSNSYVVFHSLLKNQKDLLNIFYGEKKEISGLEGFSKKIFETYKILRNYIPFESFQKILERDEVSDFLSKYPLVEERINFSFKFFDFFEEFMERENILPEFLLLRESLKFIENFEFEGIVIDSFLDFTQTERIFFEKLIKNSKNVFATIENYKNEKVEEILRKTIEFYREMDFDFLNVEKKEEREKRIQIYKFSSRDEEVEEICRKIIYEVFEKGKKFSDFIISFPNLKKYSHHIERIFYIYGVPYYLNIKENILNFQETKVIFSLLDLYIRKFSYNSFIKFITSPLLKRVPENFKEILPKYARIANILIGRDYWLQIGNILNELKEERSYAKIIDEEEIKMVESNIKKIFEVLESINPDEKKEIKEWILWIKKILESFGYFDDIYDVKIYVFQKLNSFIEISKFSPPLSLYEFRNLLWKYLEDEEISKILREKEGVRIVGLFELTGIENEVLIFGGVNEGDFPKIVETDLFLPDRLKGILGIPTRREIIKRDRLNFEKIKNNFDKILLTFPLEEDERVLLPSPFIEEPENVKEGFSEIKDYSIGEIEIQRETGERMNFKFFETFEDKPIWGSKEFREKFEKIFPGGEIYVTDIVNYKKCPYKFYLENIIASKEIEEPAPGVPGVIIGRVFHKFMENLMKEFKSLNYNLKMFENIYNMVLQKVLKDFRIPDTFRIYLRHYFRHYEVLIREKEKRRRKNGFSPIYFEKSIRKKENGFIISGRIDRIDYSPEKGIYEIIDYKTGGTKISLNKTVDTLQLYLYIYLSKELLEEDKNYRILIYTLGEEDKSCNVKRQEYEDHILIIKNTLKEISSGKFAPEPHEKGECKNCIFKNFCSLWIEEK